MPERDPDYFRAYPGQRDFFYQPGSYDPAVVDADERTDYPGTACFKAASVPGVGHDLNLEARAAQYQDLVRGWLSEVIPGGCPS
jgi:hypothetical protein